MVRLLKVVVIVLVVAFVVIQFFRPERTNPVTDPAQDLLSGENWEPVEVGELLRRSCADCHSNDTRFPWYSNIAPFSWSVADHVRVGREELNFSVWGTYSKSRKLRKLEEICEEVRANSMPHYQYLWIHWDAVLDDDQKDKICEWTQEAEMTISGRPE